jgi:hypothetical protein
VLHIIAALMGLALPQSTNEQTDHDRVVVDRAVFEMSLREFVRGRPSMRREHRHLDFTTDYCSAPVVGNEGRSFNFRHACMRHDFAYRNYRRLGILDAPMRDAVDGVFHRDLVDSCLPKRVSLRLRCLAWAEVFFESVRVAGGP